MDDKHGLHQKQCKHSTENIFFPQSEDIAETKYFLINKFFFFLDKSLQKQNIAEGSNKRHNRQETWTQTLTDTTFLEKLGHDTVRIQQLIN